MRSVLILVAGLVILGGCAAVPALNTGTANLPPVMALEELHQPYTRVGRIYVTRTVHGTEYSKTPKLHEWGLDALRMEALKMDADAVIFPEVTSKETTVFGFPAFLATEYRATGVAIKFVK